jgi:molecular chaperone GrpE
MEDHQHNEGQELDAPAAEEAVTAPSKEEEYLAGWKRAQADYANLQREVEKQRGEFVKYAAGNTIERLLPVLDNLSKAVEHAPDVNGNGNLKAWTEGIGHVRTQFASVLKDAGVKIISETGVPFDPSIHEALLREKRDGMASDTVITVIEAGYKLHDRVLRPAKVTISE